MYRYLSNGISIVRIGKLSICIVIKKVIKTSQLREKYFSKENISMSI